jgi:plastocyanin
MNTLRRPSRRILAFVACLTALAVCTSSASASISGFQEPAYTKTNGNNSYWFNWQAALGHDINGNDLYTYYLCARTERNGITVENHNGPAGPGATNCTTSLRSGPNPSTGNFSFLPFTTNTVLDDGQRYTLCGYGYYYDFVNWHNDSANLGNCPTTVLDRNAPAITAGINGADEYTKNPVLNLRIDYQDATSPPWFGSNGRASNWTCVTQGQACTPGGNPDADCSIPQAANSRINAFTCQADVSAFGDGKWYFCARSADAAMPDNPSGTNQLGGTSNNANLSGVSCGYVNVDRTGPAVTVNSSATSVKVGDLVQLSASATDAAGVSGQIDWDYGDNTGHGSGASSTHTYTAPGTYQVKASASDVPGNTGVGTTTITVAPAAGGGGGGGTTNPGGGGTTTPGGGGTTTPGGGTTTPGGGGGTTTTPNTSTGVTPVAQQQATPTVVAQMNGGGGAQQQSVGGLGVIAPKTVKFPKAKSLVLALTPESPGKAEVALLKGSKIVARKGATFSAAGTYSLKLNLPKKVKAGSYAVKVSYTPAGTTKAVTKSLKVKVTVAKKKAKKRGKAASKLSGIHGKGKPVKPHGLAKHVKVIR